MCNKNFTNFCHFCNVWHSSHVAKYSKQKTCCHLKALKTCLLKMFLTSDWLILIKGINYDSLHQNVKVWPKFVSYSLFAKHKFWNILLNYENIELRKLEMWNVIYWFKEIFTTQAKNILLVTVNSNFIELIFNEVLTICVVLLFQYLFIDNWGL